MSDILNARIILCSFGGSKGYAYFTDDATIEVGDKVLVVAPNGQNGNPVHDGKGAILGYLTLVTVTGVDETVEAVEKVREWIVGKVDLAAYIAKREREQKRSVLEAKIKRAAQEARSRIDVAALAKDNPDLQALIAQLASV